MGIYDINSQELNAVYDISGNEIEFGLPSPNVVDNAVNHNLYVRNSKQTQGACIDDNGNIYEIYYGTGKFIRYNVNTKVVTEFTTFTSGAYGHANDMAFNPNTGYIYVGSMNSTGEVYVIDPVDMTLHNTLYAYKSDGVTPITVSNICYDRKGERFICLNAGVIYFFDDNFNLINTGTYLTSDWTDTHQGAETDGNYIYAVTWKGNGGSYPGTINCIHVFSMLGVHVATVSMSDQTNEPEDLCYDWNTGLFYVSFGNGNIDFINMKAYSTAEEVDDIIEIA